MLIESGVVVAVDVAAVWVETLRRGTCGDCAARKGCGHALLNRIGGGHGHYIRALPGAVAPADCRVGDTVEIALPEAVLLRASLIVYLVPLLAMLGGAALVGGLWPRGADIAALAGAIAGFSLGTLAVRLHARAHRHNPDMQPTLVSCRAGQVAVVELS
ncbi:MAG: SoxR reducing system RseC family protein [Parahaliea sp.]